MNKACAFTKVGTSCPIILYVSTYNKVGTVIHGMYVAKTNSGTSITKMKCVKKKKLLGDGKIRMI